MGLVERSIIDKGPEIKSRTRESLPRFPHNPRPSPVPLQYQHKACFSILWPSRYTKAALSSTGACLWLLCVASFPFELLHFLIPLPSLWREIAFWFGEPLLPPPGISTASLYTILSVCSFCLSEWTETEESGYCYRNLPNRR